MLRQADRHPRRIKLANSLERKCRHATYTAIVQQIKDQYDCHPPLKGLKLYSFPQSVPYTLQIVYMLFAWQHNSAYTDNQTRLDDISNNFYPSACPQAPAITRCPQHHTMQQTLPVPWTLTPSSPTTLPPPSSTLHFASLGHGRTKWGPEQVSCFTQYSYGDEPRVHAWTSQWTDTTALDTCTKNTRDNTALHCQKQTPLQEKCIWCLNMCTWPYLSSCTPVSFICLPLPMASYNTKKRSTEDGNPKCRTCLTPNIKDTSTES